MPYLYKTWHTIPMSVLRVGFSYITNHRIESLGCWQHIFCVKAARHSFHPTTVLEDALKWKKQQNYMEQPTEAIQSYWGRGAGAQNLLKH